MLVSTFITYLRLKTILSNATFAQHKKFVLDRAYSSLRVLEQEKHETVLQ